MTHELKSIIKKYLELHNKGLSSVLATVVALDGSSYRRPGVRMLICENGEMTGAVSGGCVEKEVLYQAASVLKTGVPKMMTYDGRFRLGCEGVLYILIEQFQPSENLIRAFQEAIDKRKPFLLRSNYVREYGEYTGLGTQFVFEDIMLPLATPTKPNKKRLRFEQQLAPCPRLVIIGGEHDAVQLSKMALAIGWEVCVCTVPQEEKTISDFPGINEFWDVEPAHVPVQKIDEQTALVLMTHSYVKDLKYLYTLRKSKPMYFGLLGPSKRREKLFGEFIERYPDEDFDFFEHIHGPAGLNIGAESPEEIAIAILSEALTVIRNQEPMMLRNKTNGIHN